MDDDIFRTQSNIDYFECDIYIGTGGHKWQLATDPQTLLDWEAKLFAFIAEGTAGFIWNRDPLRIFSNNGRLLARRSSNKVPRISGWMMHDDAVDDEWLAVWVLREATKQFPEIIVSVRDADGEFLLAEAAMQIPLWLTPENSANRVFIYHGHLHIVPLGVSGTESIPLQSALQAVADPAAHTLAAVAAEKDAFARLNEYPEKLQQSIHRGRCRLPVEVAKALSLRPQLISAATSLFYARDPVQAKLLKRMKQFPAEPSVMTTVVFNRVQYAKLASQSIDIDHQLPRPESSDYKACVLGMKIACGFEILNAELPEMHGAGVAVELAQDDPRVTAFLARLRSQGCVADTLTGTPATTPLVTRALWHVAEKERLKVDKSAASPGWLISEASQSLAGAMEDSEWDPSTAVDGEDGDDSWLTLRPEQLDAIMSKAESILREDPLKQDDAESLAEAESVRALQEALEKFESFLVTDAEVEGVDMFGDTPADEYVEDSDDEVELDASGILGALMEAIGVTNPDSSELLDAKGGYNSSDATPSATNRPSGKDSSEGSPTRGANAGLDKDPTSSEHAKAPLSQIMEAMDEELSGTKIGKSFVKRAADGGEAAEYLADVDVDLNLVQNIVESFRSQQGLPGPASTLLGQFGVHLPNIDSDDDGGDE